MSRGTKKLVRRNSGAGLKIKDVMLTEEFNIVKQLGTGTIEYETF